MSHTGRRGVVFSFAVAAAAFPAHLAAQSDEDAVRAVSAAWEDAYNARDLDRLMQTYAEDAVSMAPGYPASEGRDAIRSDLETFLAEYDPEHTVAVADLLMRDDLAIERATYRDVLTPLAGGENVVDEGKHIVVYRRGEDGDWRVLWEIWNADAQAE